MTNVIAGCSAKAAHSLRARAALRHVGGLRPIALLRSTLAILAVGACIAPGAWCGGLYANELSTASQGNAGARHDLGEALQLGFSFTYVNLGQAEVRQNTVRGDYRHNDLFILGLTIGYDDLPWSGKLTMAD
jgi:hypothetical protein